MPNPATDPRASCSVLASAGTGKTWQLVARLTRLLLHGARLDSLLAITFTRKAAAEMQERLNLRLRQLLEADDEQLDELLEELGETPQPALRQRARGLFEACLRSEQRLRASTFHSFCQDLLKRFPLEAGLPPGFELTEHAGLLVDEAWDALFAEVTLQPQQPLAQALMELFDALGGLPATRAALLQFVAHRSDWWGYTLGWDDPVAEATERLAAKLNLDAETAAGKRLWNDPGRAELAQFQALLEKHPTDTNREHARLLGTVLAAGHAAEIPLAPLCSVFLTTDGKPRSRKATKAQAKSMGNEGEARFLQLHDLFCERLGALLEQRKRQRTLATNAAWYLAGARLLQHFQRLKRERRALDFADLEWHAYRLLNHPEHAHWIQYKLDERIEHLLIDEFQDTNPTQWRLILPLLEEIAAGGERQRSLFIVGDAKQSIYSFRRADPRLLTCAADWMQHRLDAPRVCLDRSWRSSPLIMECVNALFQHPQMQPLLEDFQAHATHREQDWGRVEIWPLIEAEETPPEAQTAQLRNPLLQPRPSRRDDRHYREARAITARIAQLVADGTADYDDVLILMRSRTYLAAYEGALREQAIPYISLDRGTLLQSLEIRDLEALLLVLVTPHDNLSLAQVLRSPVFSASDDELMLLAAESNGSWYERLQALATTPAITPTLARAASLLRQWHDLAGRTPIHDLLQRIFHQANLQARYCAAFPAAEHARLRANLTRFIELALEVDAGRYPTLSRFLERLEQLRGLEKEGPSQATADSDDQRRVRLLTIHAAKGLEADIVFLVDSARETAADGGGQMLVRWPAEQERPSDFLLLGNRKQRDDFSQTAYDQQLQAQRRESANLLYVAMTRARHMLVISGCAGTRATRETSWHEQLVAALCEDRPLRAPWIRTYLSAPGKAKTVLPAPAPAPVDPRLSAPLAVAPLWQEIAPSRSVAPAQEFGGDPDGALRGQVIHRLLQLASDQPRPGELMPALLRQAAEEFVLDRDDDRLSQWGGETLEVLSDPRLSWLMRPGADSQVRREVPVQFRHEGRIVYGVIDRLVIAEARVQVVDFKTHRLDAHTSAQSLARHYQPQMAHYGAAAQRLWPRHRISCYLLFTHDRSLIELPH